MILVVFGTTGELIKLAPVLTRLQRDGYPFTLATTAQQVSQIPSFLAQFGLPEPDLWLARGYRGRDLASNRDIPRWLTTVTRSFLRHRSRLRRRLRNGPGRPLVLVHGDTMTTVLAAVMGRALGVQVAHIEGGLRSGDIRNPFPEELNRRATSRIAGIHYAPGEWATRHLHHGEVIDTRSNTVRDSLELVPEGRNAPGHLPAEPFGLVSLHRFELLNSRALLTETMGLLSEVARERRLLFVDHPVTAAALSRFRLDDLIDNETFVRVPRVPFFDFVQFERRCEFVVTDSGGSQQECYYLDRPCLVHRRRTEWMEGLGENIILSEFDPRRLEEFLSDPGVHRRTTPLPPESPSDIIVRHLVSNRFAASPL